MQKQLRFWISLFCLASPLGAAEIPKQSIEQILKFAFEMSNAHGMIVGVVSGKESEIFSFGEIRQGSGIKPTGDTIWQIGSVSKALTGTIFAGMVHEGVVKLTDPLSDFVPKGLKVPNFESYPIRLVDLATHTSGLPGMAEEYLQRKDIDFERNPFLKYDDKFLYNWLNSYQLKYRPGTRYEYSNLGFGLLGDILAKKAGLTFNELVHEYISIPLGLQDTTVVLTEEQKKRKATGYRRTGEELKDWSMSQAIQGSGGIFSTANDLIKIIRASLGQANPVYEAVNRISQAAYVFQTALVNPHDMKIASAQCLGWELIYPAVDLPNIVQKSGMTGGFSAWVMFVPGYDIGLCIIANKQFLYIYDPAIDILATLISGQKRH